MNDFYDLNDLLAFYLRKIKLVILIVLIGAVGFAGFRFVSNYRQYSTQDPQTTQSNVAGEEPTWKKVTYVIQIEPQYEESVSGVIDTTKQVTDAFARCARSQDVMDELMDKYFETEKQEDVSRKESFSQYGYILDKEKDYPYTAYDEPVRNGAGYERGRLCIGWIPFYQHGKCRSSWKRICGLIIRESERNFRWRC